MNSEEETPLCKLARKHGTDKGGNHTIAGETCHTYTRLYHELFKDMQVVRLLEIGINTGASLHMWAEYFPRTIIEAIDVDPTCLIQTPRIRSHQGDQTDGERLEEITFEKRYDIIIDDGSHRTADIVESAKVLLPHLKKGGYYIIEDVDQGDYSSCEIDKLYQRIPIPEGFTVKFMNVRLPVGIGKARCRCGCGDGEILGIIHRKE